MQRSLVIKGFLTYIPGIYRIFAKPKTKKIPSARYSYEVWLKHLTLLWESGMRKIPDNVLEFGPGGSFGVGIAALLSGSRNYYAFDVVKHANLDHNVIILDELVELFKKRSGRPNKGWPDYDMYLDSNLFPSHILTEEVLDSSLTTKRIELIRNALLHPSPKDQGISIKYIVPWNSSNAVCNESIDLIISHSVLEHVTNLEDIYNAFSLLVKPMGWMSHQIDFTSHRLTKEWNGHWAYSEFLWKIIVGKRPYMINRHFCSKHIAFMKKNGFEICCHLKRKSTDGIKRSQLASNRKYMLEDDLTCSGTFIQAQKTSNVASY